MTPQLTLDVALYLTPHQDSNPPAPRVLLGLAHDDAMRIRHLLIVAALALGCGVGAAHPAYAVVPVPGEWTSGPNSAGRAVIVTGTLAVVDGGGVAVLVIDVGRRHPEHRSLTLVTTARTIITKGGRPAPLVALAGAKATVTGNRVGDRVAVSKITA